MSLHRRTLLSLVIGLLAPVCFASDIYFAQSSAGSNNGADCADAYAYNDGTHGISVSGNWVAGNTLHLCGTFSFGANAATMITAQASGSSGSPITVKFETGASLQAGYWNVNTGAINTNGKSYITIDGGTNGLIENTTNGTLGASCPAGSCSTQATTGLVFQQGANNEIKNLTLGPIYVHTQCEGSSGCDSTIGPYGAWAIQYQGSNLLVHNNVIHDASSPIHANSVGSTIDNVEFYNNEIYNYDTGIECAGAYNTTDLYIYNNHFHDMAAWDTGTADTYHHEAVHCYKGGGYKVQNLYLSNNLFDGNNGQCCVTAWVWLDPTASVAWGDATSTLYAWNNLFIGEYAFGDGMLEVSWGTNHVIYNNTFIGGNAANYCLFNYPLGTAPTNVTIENNTFEGCGGLFNFQSGSTFKSIDYNLYGNATATAWVFGSSSSSTFATWKSECNCDAHSISTGSTLADLSSEGVPSAGYLGIGAGVNLSSQATGALASLQSDTGAGNTHTPVVRSSSTAWDVGAYAYGGSSAKPNPPSNVTVTVK